VRRNLKLPQKENSMKNQIQPVVRESELNKKIVDHLNDLTKPLGSLGRLEEFALQYCLCKNNETAKLTTMSMYTFAGDHGITDQQVCPFPKAVTCQMVSNMVHGGAAISVLCKNAGIECFVVDMGVDGDFEYSSKLLNRKVARGTADFSKECAMTLSQCESAMLHGSNLAVQSGADLLGIGEMGIGNSSSASALYSMLLSIDSDRTVGAGTGSTGPMYDHKRNIIKQSVVLHSTKWDGNPIEALRRVGGFEIAGMTGMILGGAAHRIPVVVDGFIAGAAALVAMKIEPAVKDYLFFSHASAEQFHRAFFEMVGIRPVLNLDMRLGEGTGAALAMQIINQALHCYHEMATFSSAGVSQEV
jgi:nicotinate-nucleotide--dimethylbenzimidazole phosphoribosyltransferase